MFNPVGHEDHKVISYASRASTDPILKNGILKQKKRRCRKVVSETLSLIFVCGEFRSLTHHKPLEVVYGKRNANASASIERWNLPLQPYKFRIVHKSCRTLLITFPGTPLPRVYLNKRQRRCSTEVYLYMHSSIPKATTIKEMVKATNNDPALKGLRASIRFFCSQRLQNM